jgi:asparagine synthase (glutamine-hydrolysing)
MCGICGYTGLDNRHLPKMLEHIRRRGPDHEGEFSKNKIHLGATRLSIRDIKNGNQPFFHEDINFITVFNGEIYNYNFLKNLLTKEGYFLKTNCDTELLAPGFKYFGTKFFSLIEGMFSFALYDLSKNKLIISRDRYGIKPLYYSMINNELYFSSSAKSIYDLSFFKKKINTKSLQSILNKRYVEEAEHIFCNIYQLNPGQILEFEDQKLSKKSFLNNINHTQKISNQSQFIELTENFFAKNIENFKISDVPIGIMLSSGMDSNLINEKLGKSVDDIFTLDFGNINYNESKSLNKSHIYQNQKINICKFNSDAFNKIFDETIEAFDNPITDSVIFPTNFLMKEVAKKVKVAFSGEGADEIFGGYYHFSLLRYVELLKKFSMTGLIGNIISMLPNNFINLFFQYQGRLGQEGKIRLETSLKSNFNTNSDFNDLISVFSNYDLNRLLRPEFKENLNYEKNEFSKKDIILENFNKWLPNYTLYKTDQLSMHNSLEVRVPYLNNQFYDLFFQLINFRNSYFFKNKNILVKYLKNKSNIKINKKIALQNYLNDENKNVFLRMINEKIKKDSIIFNFIEFKRFEIIKQKYQSNSELILEKQLSSLLILNSWLEKNE